MHNRSRFANVLWDASLRPGHTALVILLMLLFLIFLLAFLTFTAPSARGQTFNVLHSFTGADGGNPYSGVTMDNAGNLYGTTEDGPIYKLTRSDSGWVFKTLYSGRGGIDGNLSAAGVVFGPDGRLYGTYEIGGLLPISTRSSCGWPDSGCGTVFSLNPADGVFDDWAVLYRFKGSDAANPMFGNLVFDKAGNVYGTAQYGGGICLDSGCGAVYELTPSNGSWTGTLIYRFTGGTDGSNPMSGVIFDQSGNLYGTTLSGGRNGQGTVFQLEPSGDGWAEKVLVESGGIGGLVFDQSGNLYGVTGLTVFRLTPSNEGWTFSVIYTFSPNEGGQPYGSLVLDGNGNLYGTLAGGGPGGAGAVYKLTPTSGGWTYSSLHNFTGGSDGAAPTGTLMIDAEGNVYGTASSSGGANTYWGVVFEITP